MRPLIVLTFISLDGVMQGPGGPEEDPRDGFDLGGWTVGYFDEYLGTVMAKQMKGPFDLLLGRRTYDIFAAHWPYVKDKDDPMAALINHAKKYVASRTMRTLEWRNTELIKGDVAHDVANLKMHKGPEIQVHGSGELVQTLLRSDLVDEFRLKIFPVTLGKGRRLFGQGTIPAGFRLVDSSVSPSGVIVANYARAGGIRSGSFMLAEPSGPELERRNALKT